MALQHDCIQITAGGAAITSGGTTGNVALPIAASGAPAKFCRIQADGFAYIRFGAASVVATANDTLVTPNEGVVFTTAGCTHMAALQKTVGAIVQISPLEA